MKSPYRASWAKSRTTRRPNCAAPELRGGRLRAADEGLDYAVIEYADAQANLG